MSKTMYIYIALCLLGIILPFSQFIPWLMENGFDISLLIADAAGTKIGAFAWMDVLVSAVVLILFIQLESARIRMKKGWIPIVGTCTVGVSLGLPLFLLMREYHLKNV